MKIYSVYEEPNFMERQRGQQLGACITDGYEREKVISSAEAYYCNRAEENEQYGAGQLDALLLIIDDNTGRETVEKITLKWHAVCDTYDGGRFDYYSSRGVK